MIILCRRAKYCKATHRQHYLLQRQRRWRRPCRRKITLSPETRNTKDDQSTRNPSLASVFTHGENEGTRVSNQSMFSLAHPDFMGNASNGWIASVAWSRKRSTGSTKWPVDSTGRPWDQLCMLPAGLWVWFTTFMPQPRPQAVSLSTHLQTSISV